jgi:hypothetical protein
MRVSIAVRDDMIDAFTAALNGGSIRFYDGSRPATTETAISTQVLLVTLTFNATAFGASSSASASANAIGSGTVAATGAATWARLVNSSGTAVADATVTATGGGGDIQMDGVDFGAGGTVSLSSFTISQPAGS